MTSTLEVKTVVSGRAFIRSGGFVALLLLAMFISLTPQRAQAQSSDTWKSVAIIGGSTAAGALIGHKIGGSTGAYVGAAVGAGTGYAIDHRRRQNEYKNGYYGNNGYYNNSGYYGNNSGYYGNDPYYGNGGYNGGNGGPYPYGSGYQQTGYYQNGDRSSRR